VRTCQSRSKYGSCGLRARHDPPHAVPVGAGLWFLYRAYGKAVGYRARLDGQWVSRWALR